MRFPHGETVTRHPFAGYPDEYEGGVPEFGADVAVPNVGVAWGPQSEAQAASEVRVDAVLYLPFDTDGHPHDEWTVRGLRYAQVGVVEPSRNPFTGWEAGATVALQRITG